jgi:peptidyl-prolyl cis-trans isomerase B (cyclophilin B)
MLKYTSLLPLALMVVGCGSDTYQGDTNAGLEIKSTYSTSETNAPADSNAAAPPAASANEIEEPTFSKPKDGEEVAVIETKFGKIVLKFRPDKAPKHVENFKKLARNGFYNETIFHRVIPGFMIQGGDPNTKDKKRIEKYGQGGPGYSVAAEFNNLNHKRGVLSMARSQDPNSAGSQFYICVGDSAFLNREYTAFGEAVEGMDVADQIVNSPRNSSDLPDERIEMKVKLVKWPVK